MASLIGRIFRIFCMAVLATAALSTNRLLAAPYASYVMDARTGEMLYERNSTQRLHPASLTKMMTLYIAFEEIARGRLSLDTMVTVSKHAASQPPSRLGLKPGQKIAMRYLIRAAAIKSANDAATAIGEHIAGGSEPAFAKRMTKTAKAIGMKSTTFRNANGLTAEGHLSTARDMSVLGRRLFYDFPQFYNIFSRRTADAGIAEVRNTNTRFLDAYKGADGIKTGYTVPAGFNLTASAERGGKRIIATVFGGTSTAQRNAKMAELLDIGFAEAPSKARVKKPEAPAYESSSDEALIVENDTDAINAALAEATAIDTPDVEGGAAKTIRLSGSVTKSLRPKARPAVAAPEVQLAEAVPAPDVPAPDVTAAIADGVEGALAEAMAPQTEVATEVAVAVAEAGTLDAQAVALTDPVAPLAEGSLEAQAVALAEVAPDAMVADDTATTLEAQAIALSDEPPARPKARPAAVAAIAAAETAPVPVAEVAVAEAAPVEEQVVVPAEMPAETVLAETTLDDQARALGATDLASADLSGADLSGNVTAVEEVAGATNVAPAPVALAANIQPVKRKAPIFDSVAPAPAAEPEPEPAQEVVLSVSTSGDRHFGVNVGNFTSRYEAERALFKTALAESATLNTGLRKIIEKGGKYHANFMGLTADQASLACRRLRARAIDCETIG